MSFIFSNRFLPLFGTQFLGAFNDNLLKNALVMLITYKIALERGENAEILVTIAAGLFIVPFLLFSATAGQLADKYDRAKVTRLIKIFEIIIMLLASIGFIFHNHIFLIVVLFFSGIHSSFFGPIKYALLPQHLYTNELLLGNAYIEAGTFIAILVGTIYGGLTILHNDGVYLVSLSLILTAVIGYIFSCSIPKAPAPDPSLRVNYNIVTETLKIIKYSRQKKQVFYAIIGISWFWLIGASFLSQFPNYIKEDLHTEGRVVTLFFTLFSIGIAIGSFISSKLLKGAIKSTYVPFAAMGITVFIFDLYMASKASVYFNLHGLLSTQQFLHMPESWRIILDVLLIAISAGIYIVPLYAIMQHESNPLYRARIIAANNVLNALFMVVSAFIIMGMLYLNFSIPSVFLLVGSLNVVIAWFIHKFL